jgi:hypothetical protein
MDEEIATGTPVAATVEEGPQTEIKSKVLPCRKIAIWFEGNQEFDLLPCIFFVASANTAQQSFQFYFPDRRPALTYETAKRRIDSGGEIFPDTYDVLVFVTASYLPGNLFFRDVWTARSLNDVGLAGKLL